MKKLILFWFCLSFVLASISYAADSVSSKTLWTGNKSAQFAFTNLSDGTGESVVQKIDISTLPGSPTAIVINKAWFAVNGMAVQVIFDHATDDLVLTLAGTGYYDFAQIGGLKDPSAGTSTGDLLFTTQGHSGTDTYSVVLDIGY